MKGREKAFKTESAEIPKGIREMIYDRDDDTCRYENCNERGHLDIHHRIPKSLETSNDLCNLVHVCREHHGIIQNKVPEMLNHLVAVPFASHFYDFNTIFCGTHNKSLTHGVYEKEK